MTRTQLLVGTGLAAAIAALLVAVSLAASNDPEAVATTAPTTTASTAPTEPTGTTETTTPTETGSTGIPVHLVSFVEPWETDWSNTTIDLAELAVGIPAFDPRDRIAPLDSPNYEESQSADDWLVDEEIGVQLVLEGIARFYPIRILTAHEVVNDEAGDIPYALTYCPLCNTAVAFDRRVDGRVLRFGVSGLLRKSDLVMWDDETTSLWQQISGEGIVGHFAGTQLDFLPTATVTWGDFKASHPEGESLSRDTGFGFSYGSNSYTGYTSRPIPFPTFFQDEVDPRYPAMERVVGVRVGDTTKAYPFSVVGAEGAVNDEVAATPITVWWADTGAVDNFDTPVPGVGQTIGTGIAFLATVDGQVLTFVPGDGTNFVDAQTSTTWTLFGEGIAGPLTGTQLEMALHQNEFWFAWAAFNPESPVYEG